ncbi:MAG: type I restriction-modification system subunit M [Bacilli bacterium]|nr:type I restriction-modification system subunit M [Bacilli bacterium]
MSNIETEINQKRELHTKLWKMANSLRGNMDANEFKDYILGLIFYRYVCEHEEGEFNDKLHVSVSDLYKKNPIQCREIAVLNLGLGYFIEPQYLFRKMVDKIKEGEFELEILSNAFKSYSDSTKGQESEDQLAKLFNDVNLTSDKLGSTYKEKGELIGKLISAIDEIEFNFMDSKIDLLGDAYEYLIGQFAASAGKKAGEYYTPQQVSKLLSLIVTKDLKDVKYISDPTCGSGSLLIQVADRLKEKDGKFIRIFGQELNTTTCNLARMNMLVHKVNFNKFTIHQGDTLKNPSDDQREYGKMDIVVANPPFSANWEPNSTMEKDERFSGAGKLAPKSYADYAFVEHMVNSLSANGCMAVVLPHGPLFRGNAEGVIRQYLVETRNYLDTVIGLPENLFYGTTIAACICVFKKNKTDRNVYFIDASKNFEKGKSQNLLRDEDIKKIMDAYSSKQEIEKYAHLASLDELKENEFNLNIPRYVDTFEEEEEIDLNEVMAEYHRLDEEDKKITEELNKYLEELGLPKF